MTVTDVAHATIKRILGEGYLDLKLRRFSFEEDPEAGTCKVTVVTQQSSGGPEQSVEGRGVGIIDAMFSGLLQRYSTEYQSLKSIRLTGFAVHAKLESERGRFGSDAVGEVVLEVQNSSGRPFRFSDASRSIVASAARAVVSAIGYFVNSERAFIALHKALKDAKERKRADLVAQYTRELSDVVASTSYAEVIERLRNEPV